MRSDARCRRRGCAGTYRWCPDCGLLACDACKPHVGRCFNCGADLAGAPAGTRNDDDYPPLRLFLVTAQECTADIYMGWWLYSDQIIHGKPVRTLSSAWLRRPPDTLDALAREAGATDLPPLPSSWDTGGGNCGRDAFAAAFALAFPAGLRVLARTGGLWGARLPKGDS